jgi:glycosyltransferase involved in cell wall biosynthesis
VRVLLVSSYPPRLCGIGAYARDQVSRLRAAGDDVTVLSPPDGDGDTRAPFFGGAAFRRAAAIGGRFDRIVVQFQPALYLRPRAPLSKIATSASLLWLAWRRRARLEIVVHEADPPARWRPDHVLLRAAFRRAGRLAFHTAVERAAFERSYRLRLGSRGTLVPHRVNAAPSVAGVSRQEARRRVGIDWRGPTFVSAGFLQPSKGFDRAVEAFARAFSFGGLSLDGPRAADGLTEPGVRARLYLVGSVREDSAENRRYVEALRRRCLGVRGAQLVERSLTDEEFDLWIAAADRIVLPYRRSWSSGVLARAHAVGTPAIVTATGGLAEQAERDDVVVDGDDELAGAMLAAVERLGRTAGTRGTP